MSDKPAVFQDLPLEMFPFTVTYFDADTGEQLGRDVVSGPGAYQVPAFKPHRTKVHIEYADGTVSEMGPLPETP